MNKPIYKIVLAGTPNVGKTSIFNRLTGLNHHTGNWVGKTVDNATGTLIGNKNIQITDLPGTYSLSVNSKEEEAARDYILFGDFDCIIIVADATSPERSLNLILQILEITDKAAVALNLIDEAEKNSVKTDIAKLEEMLGVPVIATSAKNGKGISELIESALTINSYRRNTKAIRYPKIMEEAISAITDKLPETLNNRRIAKGILERDSNITEHVKQAVISEEFDVINDIVRRLRANMERRGFTDDVFSDEIVNSISERSKEVLYEVQQTDSNEKINRIAKTDRFISKRYVFIPVMILFLAVIFYITVKGSGYPSEFLLRELMNFEELLMSLFAKIAIPDMIMGALIDGGLKTLFWVVSVMLPPMLIFFPLFTILEDSGFLPRIAFNLDHSFKKASASGKQALTTVMGFGCNAVGVSGTRIIDSPRERLVAILTNSFIPCNGRFPLIITIPSLFIVTGIALFDSLLTSLTATVTVVFAVGMTLLMSNILSKTVLRGVPTSFTLELPPYRMPQIGKILVRSLLDRTFFVLGRAAIIAFPVGILIWLVANVSLNDITLLKAMTDFFEPFGRILGLDGVIVIAFILGFPANEIVIPIMLMCYTASGSLEGANDILSLRNIFIENGWTALTALNTVIMCLCHAPCAATCFAIKKETDSVMWTLAAIFIPVITGMLISAALNLIFTLTGLK